MVNEVGLKADMHSNNKQHQWYPYLESEWDGKGKRKEAKPESLQLTILHYQLAS